MRGVLSSWLMLARSASLARAALSSSAFTRSSSDERSATLCSRVAFRAARSARAVSRAVTSATRVSRDHRAIRAADGRVNRLEVVPLRLCPMRVGFAGERAVEALANAGVVVRRDEREEIVSERYHLGRRRGVDDSPGGGVEGEDATLPVDEADGLRNRLQDRVRVETGGLRRGLTDLLSLPVVLACSAHQAGV